MLERRCNLPGRRNLKLLAITKLETIVSIDTASLWYFRAGILADLSSEGVVGF